MAGLTLAEVQTEIAQVRSAISAAITAQSYNDNGQSLSRVPYDQLQKRLKELLRAERVLINGGIVTYPIFETRS